ncbi:Fe-S oxidoreductase [Brenneria alni]|uniref:Fe-S oxidoreductase n=2 Tax=Brenneria alni TaxID=71656 RepID=A0A421DTM5_9GAMM|nr:Fe-S oxidoreductase [Brenneria alni]
MDNLHIAGTPCTPTVNFEFDAHRLSLSGESYPENAAAFYRPLIAQIQDYLHLLTAGNDVTEANDFITKNLPPAIEIHVSLVYFNSSSTKMLFSLFNELNQAAEKSLTIALHWYYDKDDDIAEEFGEELHIDFPALDFHSHIME